ncbi:unnamed protein product, partial [Musa hybrid cultivar]
FTLLGAVPSPNMSLVCTSLEFEKSLVRMNHKKLRLHQTYGSRRAASPFTSKDCLWPAY